MLWLFYNNLKKNQIDSLNWSVQMKFAVNRTFLPMFYQKQKTHRKLFIYNGLYFVFVTPSDFGPLHLYSFNFMLLLDYHRLTNN